jgi:cytoskeletal protein CcmA (bactofilin family)
MNFFNRKLSSDAFTSLIDASTTVEGNVSFSGILKIQGVFNGDIIRKTSEDKECLIITNEGRVSSNKVNVFDAVISGNLTAECLWVESTLRITANAVINAKQIYYRILEIEPGAKITGQMLHLDMSSVGEAIDSVM